MRQPDGGTSPGIAAVATVAVGVAAGCGATALVLLLRAVQHWAFGYSEHALISSESFLEGVSSSSPGRRVLSLVLCGILAGVGWWAIHRFGSPLVSINKTLKKDGERMPFWTTFLHDLLQIVTVGLGSPLGREVAPRELGAIFATRVCDRTKLPPEMKRTLIACGAGAGLAAVYNVPLGGALFTLEVLLTTFSLDAVIPALTTSTIAALIARTVIGDEVQYAIPRLAVNSSLTVWSALAGPFFGIAAYGFVRVTQAARMRAPRDWRLLVWSTLAFPAIGFLAIPFPQLLGNGKGIGHIALNADPGLGLVCALLLLRLVVIVASLRAGAAGGLLTPGMTVGCLLALLLGSAWSFIWPGVTPGCYAVVGGAALLGASMQMPFTAIALLMEFTRADLDFVIPMTFAVVGSYATFRVCVAWNRKTVEETTGLISGDPIRHVVGG